MMPVPADGETELWTEVGPELVLVGPPGSGKSTVGALLAVRWDLQLRDTDNDIEAQAGKTVAEIFFDEGEGRFRELERAAVDTALASHRGVLALGGGAVLSPTVRELLSSHRVVFLDVGLADAATRVGLGATRPLLLGNVRGQLKALLDERRPLYEQVAHRTVRTDGRTPDQVADDVESALHA